jgi:hypothetical protein
MIIHLSAENSNSYLLIYRSEFLENLELMIAETIMVGLVLGIFFEGIFATLLFYFMKSFTIFRLFRKRRKIFKLLWQFLF